MQLTKSLPLIEKMKLYDKAKGKFIDFKLWDRQKQELNLLHTERFIIILKKRQVGATQLVMADNLVQCMTQTNFEVLFLSIGQLEADEALIRAKEMYQSLDKKLTDPLGCKQTTTEIYFPITNSRIVSLSARNGRSFTANRVVLDEAGFYTKREANTTLDEVLMSISPVVEKAGGQIIIVSTANGEGKFKEMYFKAVNNQSSYKSFFFSCYDDPTFNFYKRDKLVNDYGEDAVNREYPRTEREAFLFSGTCIFDTRKLDNIKPATPIAKGDLLITPNKEIKLMPRTKLAPLTIIEKRLDRIPYLISADVAEGLERGDFSVAKVFNMETHNQVAEWHGHIDPMSFGTILVNLGRIYNNAVLAPEANNDGKSTITQIRNETYPINQLFMGSMLKAKADDDFKRPEHRYGFHTNSATKLNITNHLRNLILKEDIRNLLKEDISELFSYVETNGKRNAQEGSFDDRVITLAIAHYLLNNETFNRFYYPKERKVWENCSTCKYNNKGICSKSDYVIVSNKNICPVFRGQERLYR